MLAEFQDGGAVHSSCQKTGKDPHTSDISHTNQQAPKPDALYLPPLPVPLDLYPSLSYPLHSLRLEL
jgi:hypothetical protein